MNTQRVTKEPSTKEFFYGGAGRVKETYQDGTQGSHYRKLKGKRKKQQLGRGLKPLLSCSHRDQNTAPPGREPEEKCSDFDPAGASFTEREGRQQLH